MGYYVPNQFSRLRLEFEWFKWQGFDYARVVKRDTTEFGFINMIDQEPIHIIGLGGI
mgnify:CR=1 FL=1